MNHSQSSKFIVQLPKIPLPSSAMSDQLSASLRKGQELVAQKIQRHSLQPGPSKRAEMEVSMPQPKPTLPEPSMLPPTIVGLPSGLDPNYLNVIGSLNTQWPTMYNTNMLSGMPTVSTSISFPTSSGLSDTSLASIPPTFQTDPQDRSYDDGENMDDNDQERNSRRKEMNRLAQQRSRHKKDKERLVLQELIDENGHLKHRLVATEAELQVWKKMATDYERKLNNMMANGMRPSGEYMANEERKRTDTPQAPPPKPEIDIDIAKEIELLTSEVQRLNVIANQQAETNALLLKSMEEKEERMSIMNKRKQAVVDQLSMADPITESHYKPFVRSSVKVKRKFPLNRQAKLPRRAEFKQFISFMDMMKSQGSSK